MAKKPKLIGLDQINHGIDLEKILKEYDAAKVITTIDSGKTDEKGEVIYYNVDDIIKALKAGLENLQATVEDEYDPTMETTVFNLSATPAETPRVEMILNGVHYFEDEAFTVDREATPATVTWTFTKDNEGFNINENYHAVIRYTKDLDKA